MRVMLRTMVMWAAGTFAGLAVLIGGAVGARAAAPRVVATIQPLHSLAAAVMDGVGEPTLLIRGADSPHTYSMTPADARALSRADLVIWVGEALETSLVKPISALAGKAVVLKAIEAEGVEVLKGRAGGAWEPHGHGGHADEAQDAGHGHDHGGLDGHIWLDPRNAVAIARATAQALAKIDPADAARYRANAQDLSGKLSKLEAELAGTVAPVRTVPYIVFHDAYQYFERRFGLNDVGAITISPDRAPGARRIAEMRARVRDAAAVCVFAEPQFQPALVRTVVEDTKAKIGVLDPLGVDLAPGPDAYFVLMRNLASALVGCLSASG
jgi:zinc transport system substrate-binding protein